MSTWQDTSFDGAPDLIEGVTTSPATGIPADLDFWIDNVAQGTWKGLIDGHRPDRGITPAMLESAELKEALIDELSFRSIAECKATRTIGLLLQKTPDVAAMEFYATQAIDEARHARVFRNHLAALGVPPDCLEETAQEIAGADVARILDPLEAFAVEVIEAPDGFLGGVTVLTVLVEGVLAPLAELSERKWRPVNPAVGDIERGAAIDEIRHLTVGMQFLKTAMDEDPSAREVILGVIARGSEVLGGLPVYEVSQRREALYQKGLEEHADAFGDAELEPGLRLVDTTPEIRIGMAQKWTDMIRTEKLGFLYN